MVNTLKIVTMILCSFFWEMPHLEVRYLCGGICKAWVKDKHNIDSGDFDCAARKEYFLHIAEMKKEN